MKKHKVDELEGAIEEIVECQITCSHCGKSEGTYGDVFDGMEHFFKKGWRAGRENVYCPTCAKKKLKLK